MTPGDQQMELSWNPTQIMGVPGPLGPDIVSDITWSANLLEETSAVGGSESLV